MLNPLPDVPFWQHFANTEVDAGPQCRLCHMRKFVWIDIIGYVWAICRRCDVGALW